MKLLYHNLANPRSRFGGVRRLKDQEDTLRPDEQGNKSETETLAKTRVPLLPKVYTLSSYNKH